MKCTICKHGETRLDVVTVTLQRGEATVIIRGVPGEVCQNCGGHFLSEGVTREILAHADRAVEAGTEVEALSDFPDLTAEDIRACLAFAAERERMLMTVPS